MTFTDIDEPYIARHFDAKIVACGAGYFESGAVEDVVLRGDSLTATVEGSEPEPYRVQITFGGRDIADASCTCPYDAEWGGWCKHIAATLLLCAHAPERVNVGRPVAELLAALDRDALAAILMRLSKSEPGISEVVAGEAERLVSEATARKAKTVRGLPAPDPQALRKSVHRALGSRNPQTIFDKVSDLFEAQAGRRLEAGNTADALIALDALTDEYASHWFEVEEADNLDGVFLYINRLWSKAIADSVETLSSAERKSWKTKLEAWRGELISNYGIEVFQRAINAL